ncbi:hypothetical protein MASR1M68_06320 [Elusimicrobiota bacterium]
MLGIIKDIITNVVPVLMLWIAWKALDVWKREFVGKKKIDLACEIIEKVCSVQDIIIGARSQLSFSTEKDKILEELNKQGNKEIYTDKIHYLLPKYRIQQNLDTINEFLKLKNKAQLYWNKDIIKSFNEINRIIDKICIYSQELYIDKNMPKKYLDQYKKVIYEQYDNDEIYLQVQKIVDEFKLNLEPLYKDRLAKWEKFNK